MYILLSFLTGISIVINMILNGKVAEKEGMINGIIITYLIATISSIILCAIMVKSMPVYNSIANISLTYFLGGFLGLLTTYLFNIIVTKISALYIVILRFIGQMFTSAIIDYLYLGIFSKGKVIGATLFLIGLIINSNVDKKYKEKEAKKIP
ncbi:DMT family transporter [Clostridium sp.]|uniref:DMT family transporter n=1 Tax=Clostridium sp. TaxID=1506 RepID=UPI00260E0FFF|nr:DMT family transporter [Clostridium sp.]